MLSPLKLWPSWEWSAWEENLSAAGRVSNDLICGITYFTLVLAELLLRSTGDHLPVVIFKPWEAKALKPSSLARSGWHFSVAVQSLWASPPPPDSVSRSACKWLILGSGGCLGACTGKPTSGFSKAELLIPALLLKDALCIPLIKLQLHLSEDEECYSTAFKNQWLSFDARFILLLAIAVTQKKQSCHFLHFLLPTLLTPTSVQLFGEVTGKVARLTTPVPACKKPAS